MTAKKALHIEQMPDVLTFGIKGANAETKLQSLGITVPEAPNRWCLYAENMLVMRLGASEFLIEISQVNPQYAQLKQALSQAEAGLYPVARQDASWQLQREAVVDLLAEICMLDLPHETQDRRVCLTQLAGINAIVIQQTKQENKVYRIWCDGSYQQYLQEILMDMDTTHSLY